MSVPDEVEKRLLRAASVNGPVSFADLDLSKLPGDLRSRVAGLSGKVPSKLDVLIWLQERKGRGIVLGKPYGGN
jgi:hypothetical protein